MLRQWRENTARQAVGLDENSRDFVRVVSLLDLDAPATPTTNVHGRHEHSQAFLVYCLLCHGLLCHGGGVHVRPVGGLVGSPLAVTLSSSTLLASESRG